MFKSPEGKVSEVVKVHSCHTVSPNAKGRRVKSVEKVHQFWSSERCAFFLKNLICGDDFQAD